MSESVGMDYIIGTDLGHVHAHLSRHRHCPGQPVGSLLLLKRLLSKTALFLRLVHDVCDDRVHVDEE